MIETIKHYSLCKCRTLPKYSDDMPKGFENRYEEIKLSDENILRFDNTGDYTPQGACLIRGTDYLVRALVKSDDLPTKLQKINKNTGEIVLEVADYSCGHANDMTYNAVDGYLYIAHSSSTSIVYKVNPNTLALVDTLNFGPTIWGLAHEPTNNLYALGNVGSAYMSVYNNSKGKPDFMYRLKPDNAYSAMVRQGIDCDSNYLYVALDNAYGAEIENDKGSRVMVFTWNSMFIKSLFIDIAEIEFIAVESKTDNVKTFYIGTYEGRDLKNQKSGYIYKVDVDLYPEQTVLTGRPTDVSGGLNNLQRLPEGTPVRLYNGEGLDTGLITLDTAGTQLKVDEDGPFRYLKIRFKGANAQVFDWYPVNNGVPTLREFDITAAKEDTTIRFREMRLIFNATNQTFTIDSNFNETLTFDASEGAISITKDVEGTTNDRIFIEQIWGIV